MILRICEFHLIKVKKNLMDFVSLIDSKGCAGGCYESFAVVREVADDADSEVVF